MIKNWWLTEDVRNWIPQSPEKSEAEEHERDWNGDTESQNILRKNLV